VTTHPRLLHSRTAHGSFQGRASHRYDIMARLLRRLYRRIAEDVALVAPPDGAVLDVGTGPGVLLAEIARARPDVRVTGVDLSADMVAAAARNVARFGDRAAVRVGDVADLPFADATFDVVVTSFSMHHWADLPAAVPELARVLRPGGRVHVYDFARAPFDALGAAVRDRRVFTGQPAQHTVIGTGQLHLRHCVRHVLRT
jgi:ubiquinone/menaquinone biosynthesis C-methylase UbiE